MQRHMYIIFQEKKSKCAPWGIVCPVSRTEGCLSGLKDGGWRVRWRSLTTNKNAYTSFLSPNKSIW